MERRFSRWYPWGQLKAGLRVQAVLERLADTRGLPRAITVDNGPEFDRQVLDKCAYRRNVHLSFIRPGKPNENAYIESFNGKFRDECLNVHWFSSLAHARSVIEAWRMGTTPSDHTAHSRTSHPKNSQVSAQTTLQNRFSYPRTLTPIRTKTGVRSGTSTLAFVAHISLEGAQY